MASGLGQRVWDWGNIEAEVLKDGYEFTQGHSDRRLNAKAKKKENKDYSRNHVVYFVEKQN